MIAAIFTHKHRGWRALGNAKGATARAKANRGGDELRVMPFNIIVTHATSLAKRAGKDWRNKRNVNDLGVVRCHAHTIRNRLRKFKRNRTGKDDCLQRARW